VGSSRPSSANAPRPVRPSREELRAIEERQAAWAEDSRQRQHRDLTHQRDYWTLIGQMALALLLFAIARLVANDKQLKEHARAK
jgi:hypothetical protein